MTANSTIRNWLGRLAVPAWISGPDRRLDCLNDPACALLAIRAGKRPGAACHEVVAACERAGRSFCSPDCPLRRSIAGGSACAPVVVRIHERWVLLVGLPLGEDGRCSVVHFALDASKVLRMEDYLDKVANQDGHVSRTAWGARFATLTSRHREVLQLLAMDESPASIARLLHRSILTVRNHVQRVLASLGVHSVQQAVALFLLYGDGRDLAPDAITAPTRLVRGSRDAWAIEDEP